MLEPQIRINIYIYIYPWGKKEKAELLPRKLQEHIQKIKNDSNVILCEGNRGSIRADVGYAQDFWPIEA